MNTSVAEKRPSGALGRMGAVAGLHAGALYLIAASLGIVPPLIEQPPKPFEIIDQPSPPDAPPDSIPKPQPYNPTLFVPEPEVAPVAPVSLDVIGAELNNDPPVLPDVVPPPPAQHLVGVRMDSSHPLSQPAYPITDIRQGNEGTAEIEVYVLPNGRIGDARIVKSAGSPTLDQSALEEARRRWRLLPATRDGEPYAEWHRLKVTFNLKNR